MTLTQRIATAITACGTTLTELHGVGPVTAAVADRTVEPERDPGVRSTRAAGAANRDHASMSNANWAPLVAAGRVHCWRCLERIQPGESWDLGHVARDGRRNLA